MFFGQYDLEHIVIIDVFKRLRRHAVHRKCNSRRHFVAGSSTFRRRVVGTSHKDIMTEILNIIVSPAAGSPGKFDAHLDGGRYLVTSTSPLIDACRILIEHGCDPETKVAMRHLGRDYDAIWGRV